MLKDTNDVPIALCVFQDEQKAEDELAKKRAAFLLKQQKKAEEARLRKQQLEAESELKRDEARYFFSQCQYWTQILCVQKCLNFVFVFL